MYATASGETKLEVKLEDETVWLTQAQMAKLFDRDQSVISRHLSNVFEEGELEEKGNMQILHIASSDKPIAFYNLDVLQHKGTVSHEEMEKVIQREMQAYLQLPKFQQ